MKRLICRRFLNLIFLLLITLVVGAVARQRGLVVLPAETELPGSSLHPGYQSRRDYPIWAGDVLDLRVLGHPELESPEITVDQQGLIRLPQIEDEIRAGCLTVKELKAEILSRHRRHSNENLQISLRIVQNNSPFVTLKGAVLVPRLRLTFKPHLLEVLSMAGGVTRRAKGIVEIRHQSRSERCLNSSPGEDTTLRTYRIEDVKAGGYEANPYVYPGDIILVPEQEQVHIIGAVVNAGTYSLGDSDTLTKVIEKAGGISADAGGRRVEVCRRVKGANSGESSLVDLESIRRREKKDVILKPNDVIYVPPRNRPKGTCKNSLIGLPPTGISY